MVSYWSVIAILACVLSTSQSCQPSVLDASLFPQPNPISVDGTTTSTLPQQPNSVSNEIPTTAKSITVISTSTEHPTSDTTVEETVETSAQLPDSTTQSPIMTETTGPDDAISTASATNDDFVTAVPLADSANQL